MTLVRVGALIVFVLVVVAVGLQLRQAGLLEPDRVRSTIAGMGPWAPVAFMGLGVAFVLLALPGWTTTVLAGFLFGPVWGVVFAALAATTGAILCFLIARGLGRDFIQARLGARLRKLDDGLATRGFRYMLFLRVLPFVPFVGISYGAGVSRVRFESYVLATLLGPLPMTAVYAYLGSTAGPLLQAALGH